MREYPCHVCGKVFPRPKTLEIHIRSHTGEKPYPCIQCSKKFASKRNMLLHSSRMHKQDKPSPLLYSSNPDLKTQFSIHPPPLIVNAARKILPHKCSKCEKSFPSNFALKRHIEKNHPKKVSQSNDESSESDESTSEEDESAGKKDERSKKKAKKEGMEKMFSAMLQEYFRKHPVTQISSRYSKVESGSTDLDEAIRIQQDIVRDKEKLVNEAGEALLEARENLVKSKEELFEMKEKRRFLRRNRRPEDEPCHSRDVSSAGLEPEPLSPNAESEGSTGTESPRLTTSGTKKRKDSCDPIRTAPTGQYPGPRQECKKRKKSNESDEQENETESYVSQEINLSPQGSEANSQRWNQSVERNPPKVEQITPQKRPITPNRNETTAQMNETRSQITPPQNLQDRDEGNAQSRDLTPHRRSPTSFTSGEQVVRSNEQSCSTNGNVAMDEPSTSRQSDHARPSCSYDQNLMEQSSKNEMDYPDSDDDISNPLQEHTRERALADRFLANTFNKIKQQRKNDRNHTPDFVNGVESPEPLDLHAPSSSSSGERPTDHRRCSPTPGIGLGQSVSGEIFQFFTDENGNQKFRCNMCNKIMNSSYHMKHQLVHMQAKPYRCEFCGKTFSQNSSLIQHRRLHTGEKPYECQYCDKCFPRKIALSNHMKKLHPGRQ